MCGAARFDAGVIGGRVDGAPVCAASAVGASGSEREYQPENISAATDAAAASPTTGRGSQNGRRLAAVVGTSGNARDSCSSAAATRAPKC